MSKQLYAYNFGSDRNAISRYRKKKFKGRKCFIVAYAALNSVRIEFTDNGEQLCCSRNALKKAGE